MQDPDSLSLSVVCPEELGRLVEDSVTAESAPAEDIVNSHRVPMLRVPIISRVRGAGLSMCT